MDTRGRLAHVDYLLRPDHKSAADHTIRLVTILEDGSLRFG
jgi:hypothetical protein